MKTNTSRARSRFGRIHGKLARSSLGVEAEREAFDSRKMVVDIAQWPWHRAGMSYSLNASAGDGDGKLVRVRDAAEILGVSVRTVWRMFSDGQLTPVRFRRCTRVLASEIAARMKVGGKVGVS